MKNEEPFCTEKNNIKIWGCVFLIGVLAILFLVTWAGTNLFMMVIDQIK
jgi:hypothetical protein